MTPDQGPRHTAHAPLVDTSILLISDNKNTADTIHSMLDKEGYSVQATGTTAVANQSSDMTPPDLVIIDQQAQALGAIEMCAHLGANLRFQAVPIFVVGQQGDAALKERAFNAGSTDWLEAPVQKSELLAKVKSCLDLQQMRKSQSVLKRQLAEERNRYEALIHDHAEELTKAKAQAEEAKRAKSSFLSHMSHELRTPLNAILGFSRLMERSENLTETQSENLRLIYKSGKNLLRLINDVLDMSRIETGNNKLEIAVVDLPQLMQAVAVKSKTQAAEQGLTFSLNLEPALPRHVKCDEHKLQQILTNLVSNGLKFTQTGGIEINARVSAESTRDQTDRTGEADRGCDLEFEIRDTGPGIAQEDLERIFDPFFKTKSPAVSNRGSGLGLTISRNFARLMGGDITAANCPDRGACFSFHLRLETATEDVAMLNNPPDRVIGIAPGSQKYRVLVVDDDITSRMLLSELLNDVGLEVEKAEDGVQAVEGFARWEPDIIFMDMRMPGMDGLTATQHIKATEKGRQTPVIALTGQTLESDRRKILSAGCDDYLAKPIEEEQLFDVITKHLDVTFIREGDQPSVSTPPKEEAATTDEMTELPATVLTEMKKIALELDLEKFKACLEHIQSDHPELEASLSTLSNRFRFEEIYNLCDGALKSKK